jgi:hypothetical protein
MIQKYFEDVKSFYNISCLKSMYLLPSLTKQFPTLSAEDGQRGREATALFCVSRKAKRKNFRSLIEKILSGARIKIKNVENFSVLLLRRSGGVAPAQGGFCARQGAECRSK